MLLASVGCAFQNNSLLRLEPAPLTTGFYTRVVPFSRVAAFIGAHIRLLLLERGESGIQVHKRSDKERPPPRVMSIDK